MKSQSRQDEVMRCVKVNIPPHKHFHRQPQTIYAPATKILQETPPTAHATRYLYDGCKVPLWGNQTGCISLKLEQNPATLYFYTRPPSAARWGVTLSNYIFCLSRIEPLFGSPMVFGGELERGVQKRVASKHRPGFSQFRKLWMSIIAAAALPEHCCQHNFDPLLTFSLYFVAIYSIAFVIL